MRRHSLQLLWGIFAVSGFFVPSVPLSTPNASRTVSASELPMCYTHGSRHNKLAGSWIPDTETLANPPFWNLSCPLEWSKYSCVYIYADDLTHSHATKALRRFVPNKCQLPIGTSAVGTSATGNHFDGQRLAKALAGRNLFLAGDSLARQVFVSLGCRTSHVDKYDAAWGGPTGNKVWPGCHTDVFKGCKNHGEHSLFWAANFTLEEQDGQRWVGRWVECLLVCRVVVVS